jgi:hypothetical protein
MAVVINEFEAVAEAPAPARGQERTEGEPGEQPTPLEPKDIAKPLHVIASQALRSWAH